jgi:hypothetical protein
MRENINADTRRPSAGGANLTGRGGIESVTESKSEPIEDIRRIVERWGELLKPHQDANGQVKQQ